MRSALCCALLSILAPAIAAPEVVTTVAPITDLVRRVGGDTLRVTALVPAGADSHTFEPAPSAAALLGRADLIIANGLFLEEPVLRLAAAVKRPATPILLLAERALPETEWRFDFSFPRAAGYPNPHLWTDVTLAMRYVELIADALIGVEPARSAEYRANRDAQLARLRALDAAIFACVASIPAERRKLVTYHDSFAYFAPRYGMEVVGAVQPADFSEPSPREVARLIEQLRASGVRAIFGSAVFHSPVLEQVARESGARFIDALRDDSLPGEPGETRHSYVGMMAENLRVMTAALGGLPACMDGF